jgi:hypothetical protein
MGTDSDFSNLLTSNVTEGSNEFRAAHVATVRDFVVFGNIRYDSTRFPNRVWWTGVDNPLTITPSATTQADFQDLPDTGWVQRIHGGETGIVICERGVWSMRYTGAPVIWQFDLMVPQLACSFPWGSCQHQGIVYMLSDEGFVALTRGGGLTRIGAEKVDRYFFTTFAAGAEHRVSCAADPRNDRVMWAFPSPAAATGTCDKILAFDTKLGRWSLIEQTVEVLLQAGLPGYDIDNAAFKTGGAFANLDAMTISLDSDIWRGGKPQLAAIDSAHKLALFDGSFLAATVETLEQQIAEGLRAMVVNTRPLIDSGTATIAIGSRNRQTDPVTWSTPSVMRDSGVCNHRSNARYHRARIATSGAFGRILGLEVEWEQAGGR